ncbi:MAG: HAD family hydrolase [Actinobacteria bacterium]|nr:HAD family hydrolase [Actinomycetota bacterium]
MSAPAAVTFDFGNTLTTDPDWEAVREARVRHIVEWLDGRGGENPDALVQAAFESARLAGRAAWEGERRHFGAGDSLNHIFSELRVETDADGRTALLALLEDPLPARRLLPIDGAADVLRQLREAGLRLGIVSNLAWGPATVMRRHLDQHGLIGFFEPEALAFSDEVGVLKPHPAIFHAALDALGASPQEAAHVGDLKLTDVAGAHELGMITIRYAGIVDDPTDAPDADHVVRGYAELPGVLGL